MTERKRCPICNLQLVPYVGPKEAAVLLVGSYPGDQEIIRGEPFVGETGDVLREELARVGIQLAGCRRGNLWQHTPNDKENDLEYHLKMTLHEMQNHPYILVMGAQAVHNIAHLGVDVVQGLEITHPMVNGRIICSPNPAQLFHGSTGEFRLALQRLKEMISS